MQDTYKRVRMSKRSLGRVMVLGSRGMVGASVIRELEKSPNVSEILAIHRRVADLTDQSATFDLIKKSKPDWIIMAAAKVGGIVANNALRKDFIYENLAIQLNILEGAFRAGVTKLVFLGSSCIYPKFSKQPISENALLTGALEPTNEPYAVAKIAGIKLCEAYNSQFGTDYRSLMPTNLYGPGDNFDPDHSHVIPGLIRRFHDAKNKNEKCISVWGTGQVRREFLFVDDLANAIIHVMHMDKRVYDNAIPSGASHINIGTGEDVSIEFLANQIKTTTEFRGEIKFDISKPEGTPQKLLDVSVMKNLGWNARTDLKDGLSQTYDHFINDLQRRL